MGVSLLFLVGFLSYFLPEPLVFGTGEPTGGRSGSICRVPAPAQPVTDQLPSSRPQDFEGGLRNLGLTKKPEADAALRRSGKCEGLGVGVLGGGVSHGGGRFFCLRQLK